MKDSVKVMFVFSTKESQYQLLKYTMFYIESHSFQSCFLRKKIKENNHGASHEVLTLKLTTVLTMPINNILTTCGFFLLLFSFEVPKFRSVAGYEKDA